MVDTYANPFNDNKLIYDFNTHRYLLNEAYVQNVFGEFTLSATEWQQLKYALTDNVYSFIYSFKHTREDYDHMEYELAKNQYFREVIAYALLYQYEYAISTSGDVVQLQHGVNVNSDKNLSTDTLRGELMISTKGYLQLHSRGLLETAFKTDFDYTNYRNGY